MFFLPKNLKKTAVVAGTVSHRFLVSFVNIISPVIGVQKIAELWKKYCESELVFTASGEVIAFPEIPEDMLRQFSFVLIGELSHIFGKDFAENNLRMVFQKISADSDERNVSYIFQNIPKDYLEDERLKFLTKEELEKLVKEKQELTKKLLKKEKELIDANEQLRSIDQVKDEFVSVAAHQLRTPLSAIKWTMKMLLDGDLGELTGEQKEFIAKSAQSNNRLIALVNDMLSVDQIRSGKMKFVSERAHLQDLISNVISDLGLLAKEREQTITFVKDNQLPDVFIDIEKTRAVLQNLLENSIKYSPKKSEIVLSTKTEGDHIVVSVKDSGIGIPEAEKKFLFRRFFRASNAKRTETDGSGLGLFFIRKIIEKQEGKIWFESEENKGTTFHFTVQLFK